MKKYQKKRPKIKKIRKFKDQNVLLRSSRIVKKERWFLLVYLLNMILFVLIFLTAKIKSILQS